MAKNLDLDKSGFIHWRVMFTYFLLLKSAIPNDGQIKEFKESCINAKFWFDETEASL
jgi:hypothetical protein